MPLRLGAEIGTFNSLQRSRRRRHFLRRHSAPAAFGASHLKNIWNWKHFKDLQKYDNFLHLKLVMY